LLRLSRSITTLLTEFSTQETNYAMQPTHFYELRRRKDHRGVNLISGALPLGRPR
jgi:hypothetical protein